MAMEREGESAALNRVVWQELSAVFAPDTQSSHCVCDFSSTRWSTLNLGGLINVHVGICMCMCVFPWEENQALLEGDLDRC